MKRRIHFNLTECASEKLEEFSAKANEGFQDGNISVADCLNFIIESAKPDVASLQIKMIDPRKLLANAAKSEHLDIDSLIAKLRKVEKGSVSNSNKVSKGEE